MTHPITVVDSFTDVAFRGNPAGVCILAAPTSEDWMQAVASELNLAETAFAAPRAGSTSDYDLRWFTPTTEVELCGHATLATTSVLDRVGAEVRFHTKSGELVCQLGEDGWIEMDFPATRLAPVANPPDVSGAIGLAPDRIVEVFEGGGWKMVEVASPDDVRAVVPDRQAILDLGGEVLVVAAPGDREGIDSVCRNFIPGFGIDEDPVTGAAHCIIGPWLAARTGRTEFVGEQASRRGGTVGMRVVGDRVILRGQAVRVMDAQIHSSPP